MRLFLKGSDLALDFPFDSDRVDEIKRVEGARWDKVSRLWIAPVGSIDAVRDFAIRHNFDVEDEVLRILLPQRRSVKKIYLSGEWIYIQVPYDKVVLQSVKRIPGITWDKREMAWRSPTTSVKNVLGWAEMFSVDVGDDLRTLASEMDERLNRLIDASRSTNAEIDLPGLSESMFPYQRAGVAYAAKAKRCFIADEMGLGKSIQAIATLEYVAGCYPALVVCPPSLVLNWKKEYEKWLPSKKVVTITDRKNYPDEDFDVLVMGYSNIDHWEKQLKGFNACVFDESHYVKSPSAKRTKAAIKIAKSVPKSGMVLCLTGTPVTNRPAEYASQLDVIGKLSDFGGLWGFYRRYCNAFQDRFGQWNISGNSNLDELNDRLRGTCYIRRTKSQVLSELPPVMHSPVVVEGTPAQMKEYKKAEDDIIKYITDRAKEIALEMGVSPYSAAVVAKIRAESNEHLVKMSVLRRIAARAKMSIAEEWIKERVEAGSKVVVAAHHREIVDEVANKFGGLKIQGGMDVSEVERHKQLFQESPVEQYPVIVLSIQAAKTGHTLTAAQDILFIEMPWTPADVDQTYSRLHRIGQQGSVTATYMLTSGTIDEKIYGLIEKKRSVVNAAVDGYDFSDGSSSAQLVLDLMGIPAS